MDKTFAETQGKPSFDWNLALANPPKIDSEEHKQLVKLSGDWVTCACGNQCAIIPRSNGLVPDDKELNELGIDFCKSICFADWPLAKYILLQIEARSTILITQELAKLQNP